LREGETKIIDVLLYTDEALSFTEIKERTELSPPSLSENLKRLNNRGLILKNEKTKKYRITKGTLLGALRALRFNKGKLKIEEKLMYVFGVSTSLFWRSFGYKQGFNFEKTKGTLTEEMIKNRKEVVKHLIDNYNSLLLYSLWEILLFSYHNEDYNIFKRYIEDYFQPVLYMMKEVVKSNDDVLDVFNNSLVSLRNNLEQRLDDNQIVGKE